ncbi:hypothetical protein AH562_10115 [Salmonella enterica]|nr:hypothetical protein [Salmonella enterica]
MEISFLDEGAYARIWITGPFWQIRAARRIAEAGLMSSPVDSWESKGITFQITLFGKNSHVLRAYKAIARATA